MIIEAIGATTGVFSAYITYKAFKYSKRKNLENLKPKKQPIGMFLQHKIIPLQEETQSILSIKVVNKDNKPAYFEDIYWSNEGLFYIWDVKSCKGSIPSFIKKKLKTSKSETSMLDANSLFSGLWPGVKLNTWNLFSFIKYSKLNIKNSFEETLSCKLPKSLKRQLFIENSENTLLAKLLVQYL